MHRGACGAQGHAGQVGKMCPRTDLHRIGRPRHERKDDVSRRSRRDRDSDVGREVVPHRRKGDVVSRSLEILRVKHHTRCVEITRWSEESPHSRQVGAWRLVSLPVCECPCRVAVGADSCAARRPTWRVICNAKPSTPHTTQSPSEHKGNPHKARVNTRA
jgi:hypothetical protein